MDNVAVFYNPNGGGLYPRPGESDLSVNVKAGMDDLRHG